MMTGSSHHFFRTFMKAHSSPTRLAVAMGPPPASELPCQIAAAGPRAALDPEARLSLAAAPSGCAPKSRAAQPIGVMTRKYTTPMKIGVVTFEMAVRQPHPRALDRTRARDRSARPGRSAPPGPPSTVVACAGRATRRSRRGRGRPADREAELPASARSSIELEFLSPISRSPSRPAASVLSSRNGPSTSIVDVGAHEAAVGVLGRADDRLAAHVERRVHHHRAAGAPLERLDQRRSSAGSCLAVTVWTRAE